MYATQIREALTGAIDTGKLAEAWQALHPAGISKSGAGQDSNLRPPGRPSSGTSAPQAHSTKAIDPAHSTKAIDPALSAFLAAARDAILRALRAILPKAWTEGWVLGQQSAQALTAGLETVDWAAWTPGDYAAAEAIAGAGLRQLLAAADIEIKSIAESRLEELSAVLEATLASDEIKRPPLPEPLPPMLSVSDLARQLKDVLDNPANAELVAQAEIGRAQAEAARVHYAEQGVAEIEISTAQDDKVCPVCDAAQELGAHPVGTAPMVLLHPRCRCAELPVLA